MLSDITTLENMLNRQSKAKFEKDKNILKDEVSHALDNLIVKFLDKKDLEKVKDFFPDVKMLAIEANVCTANVNEQTTRDEIENLKLQLSDNMKIVEVDVKIETDLNELSNEESD